MATWKENLLNNFFPDGFNYNLCMIYLFTLSNQLSRAIWDGSIVSSYIYIISNHSNFIVGSLTGLNGLVQLIFSPICGWAADRYSRSLILKIASLIGIIGIAFTIYSVLAADLVTFAICMVVWGIFTAFSAPTTDALLADSVNSGSRSKVYSMRQSVIQISSSFGPALSILLFVYLGDEWSKMDCQIVMVSGLALFIIPCIILNMFQSSENEPVLDLPSIRSLYLHAIQYIAKKTQNSTKYSPLTTNGDVELENSKIKLFTKPLIDNETTNENGIDIIGDSNMVSMNEIKVTDIHDEKVSANSLNPNSQHPFYVPVMIAVGDIITGLASGMTIKFFPIYFMDNLHLSPIGVSCIYLVTPWFITFSVQLTQRISLSVGRILATVITKFFGVILLLLLTYMTSKSYSAIYIIPVYIARSAFINSSKPLTKSIIMDVVPRNQRARWNAAESINSATWSGSAMLGGYLIDKYGIIPNFVFTAILQLSAAIPLLMIARYVPAEAK